MIRKLKRRFTVLATASIFLLMAVLVLIMNIVNYSSVVSEIDSTMDVLAPPGGFFSPDRSPFDDPGRIADFIPRGMSPEVPYEARFFTVMVTADGEVINPDFSRIISVDSDSSEEYVRRAVESRRDRGFIGQFRFSRTSDDRMTRILFLDCGRKLDAFRLFLWTSVGVGLFGCLLVFVAFLFVSGRIVKPIAESYEKQKRFISDAGHEIKTPLTIINANLDLLESDGDQEELGEIRQQTVRLTELTNNLVYLSKMEEGGSSVRKVEMPLSDIVGETAASFRAPALSARVALSTGIEPGITLTGSPDAIRQLVSILLENAVKYSPEGGTVSLTLARDRKAAVLSVFNTTAERVDERDLPFVFDRFYRTDSSRNSTTGGHGIGLSIAKAIAEAHGGGITADTGDGSGFRVTVSLPQG